MRDSTSTSSVSEGLTPRWAWPVGVASLVGLYLISRLWRLGSWLFLLNDEAIELHRALLIRADVGDLWLPMVDYKAPFFYWLAAGVLGLVEDPIVAVRLISVVAGLGTLAVLLWLTSTAVGRATALLAGLFFVLAPYGMVFDRLGLMEPWVAFLTFSAFALLVGPGEGLRPDLRAVLVGAVLGLAFLSKQSVLIFLPFPVVWTVLAWRRRPKAWVGLLLVFAAFAVFVVYLLLAPDFEAIYPEGEAGPLTYHGSYTLGLVELMAFPWRLWVANANTLWVGLSEHLTPVVVLMALAAAGWLAAARRESLVLAVSLYLVIPLTVICLVATGLPGRVYMLAFVVAPTSILAARFITAAGSWALRRRGRRAAVAVVTLFTAAAGVAALARDMSLLMRPLDHLMGLQEGVLVEPGMSEHRVGDAAAFLAAEAAEGPIVVLMDISYGMPNDGLTIHLWEHPNVELVYAWWVLAEHLPVVPDRTIEAHVSNHHRTGRKRFLPSQLFSERRVFWVVNSLRYPPDFVLGRAPEAELVEQLPSPDGSSLNIYLVAR